MYRSNIDTLTMQLKEERESNKKTRNDIQTKEGEFVSVQKDLGKLKDIYESKIKLLNAKINNDEDILKDMKSEIKVKNEVGENNIYNLRFDKYLTFIYNYQHLPKFTNIY